VRRRPGVWGRSNLASRRGLVEENAPGVSENPNDLAKRIARKLPTGKSRQKAYKDAVKLEAAADKPVTKANIRRPRTPAGQSISTSQQAAKEL
jgi:hypothetical protein